MEIIAPKFTGRFNKSVDCIGDAAQFRQQFEGDLCIIKYGVQTFDGVVKRPRISSFSMSALIGSWSL